MQQTMFLHVGRRTKGQAQIRDEVRQAVWGWRGTIEFARDHFGIVSAQMTGALALLDELIGSCRATPIEQGIIRRLQKISGSPATDGAKGARGMLGILDEHVRRIRAEKEAQMKIDTCRGGEAEGLIVIRVEGEIDVYNSQKLKQAIEDAFDPQPEQIVIDMTAVTWLDSTALGVLVGMHKRCRAGGIHFALVITEARVERVFAVSGLDTIFNIFPDTVSAVRAHFGG